MQFPDLKEQYSSFRWQGKGKRSGMTANVSMKYSNSPQFQCRDLIQNSVCRNIKTLQLQCRNVKQMLSKVLLRQPNFGQKYLVPPFQKRMRKRWSEEDDDSIYHTHSHECKGGHETHVLCKLQLSPNMCNSNAFMLSKCPEKLIYFNTSNVEKLWLEDGKDVRECPDSLWAFKWRWAWNKDLKLSVMDIKGALNIM